MGYYGCACEECADRELIEMEDGTFEWVCVVRKSNSDRVCGC